jgi:excisionase family DNA binding protein
MLNKSTPEYLSLTALAVYASASRNTLKKWLACGMPCFRIGRCIRVKRSEFDAWIKQFRVGASDNLDAVWDQVMKEAS